MTAAFVGEIHPLAARWPMMPDDELAALAESIATEGLRSPLTLDGEGRLIDGRNRLAACGLAGVEPHFETVLFPGEDAHDDDIRGFIAAANAHRRNITTGQKAMACADDLAAQGLRRNGRWHRGSITQESGLSREAWTESMRLAGLVIDWRPDLTDQVIAGDVTLNAAAEQAEAARDVQARAEAEERRQAAQLADLQEHRPDLAALVDAGDLPLGDALTIRDKETEAERKAEADRREAIRKTNVDFACAVVTLEHIGTHLDAAAFAATFESPLHTFTADQLRAAAGHLIGIADEWENQ